VTNQERGGGVWGEEAGTAENQTQGIKAGTWMGAELKTIIQGKKIGKQRQVPNEAGIRGRKGSSRLSNEPSDP